VNHILANAVVTATAVVITETNQEEEKEDN
jgi:hypothetical protein